ncbi:MAG: TetR/AcrR family transcriptional regulator [Pseudomonadota bacterium]
MGRNRLTAAEESAFRSRLLDAALELFADEGYDSVSIRALAKRLGCSAMTPYRYFADKAAIFDACRCRAFDAFANAQEAVALATSDPKLRIRALGQAYADFAEQNPHAFRLMFELAQPQEPSSELADAEQRAFETIRRAVSEAVQAGAMTGDSNTLAHLLWTTLHGIVVLNLSNKLVHGRSKHELLTALFAGELAAGH